MTDIAVIAHRYSPGQKEDLHDQLLVRSPYQPLLLIERWIDRGQPLLPRSHYFARIPGAWPAIERLDRFVSDKLLARPYRKVLEAFFRRHLTGARPALLHAQFGMAGLKVLPLKAELGVPLFVTFFGVDVSYCLRVPYYVKAYQDMFEVGDRFLVLGEEAKRRLVAIGCPPEKVRLWNCMVDFSPYPYRPRPTTRPFKLLVAARFVEKKGYPYMLAALEALRRSGYDVTLTIIGYGPDKKQILQDVKQRGLESAVVILDTSRGLDFTTTYAELLVDHHIFILSSTVAESGDDEGGPALTLIMAQAAGLPVVCTPFAGAERSVVEGETGFFASQDSADDLAAAIAALLDRPDRWDPVGYAASMYVREHFSVERQADRLFDMYREFLG